MGLCVKCGSMLWTKTKYHDGPIKPERKWNPAPVEGDHWHQKCPWCTFDNVVMAIKDGQTMMTYDPTKPKKGSLSDWVGNA